MKRLTTDTGLIDYFWSLVDKSIAWSVAGEIDGGKIPLLALDGIH
jgi:hypothetical protein